MREPGSSKIALAASPSALGGPGAAVVVGLHSVFRPIPSGPVLPLAGFAASRGVFSPARKCLATPDLYRHYSWSDTI